MANFIYRIDTHLLRPSNIITNITYQANSTVNPLTFSTASETSTIVSPFDGNAVNLNFFNLAMAVTDLTYQTTIFQSWSNNVESTIPGFVNYNGRQESESTLYGGSPFFLSGATSFTVPYTMDNTATKAFQIAATNALLYNSSIIDQVNSRFRPIVFGEAGAGSPFSTPTALASYMNSRLKYNTNDATNAFAITGNVNPNGGNWATGFGTIISGSPSTYRSFYLFWNDGFTAYSNNLTTLNATTGVITLTSTGVQVGQKCTLNVTLTTNTLTYLQSVIQNLFNSAIGNGTTFTVAQYPSGSPTFLQLNILNDRTQSGVFQVTLQKDVVGDNGTNGILEWLGWNGLAAGAQKTTNPCPWVGITLAEAYDYTSLIQFVPAGVGPYTFNIVGIGAYASLAFIDNYSSGTPLLSSFGFPTATTTYYNTRRPATTYLKTLNYGGPLWATTLGSTGDTTVLGNLKVAGSINANSVLNPYILPSYISNSGFEFNTINNVAPALWIPYANASASTTPTSGGAASVYTYTVTFTSNPGGTLFINGVSVSVPSSLSTSTAIAQFLGTLTQAGYVFNYTGTNTFTIAVSGPYANPTVVNGTLTSGMVSFGVTNTFGVPSNLVTLLANNVNPLYGAFDADITKPAGSFLGQGYSIPFSIDRGATGQPFQLSFYYNTSGGYLSGDLAAFVYDVTNASLIPLSVSSVPTSPAASLFTATFVPSTSLNYRFIFHIASANVSAWVFEFDMLAVVPQSPLLTIAPSSSGMTTFPMILSSSGTAPTRGTGVTEYAGWRRSIDQMELLWTYSQTGAGSAGTGTYFWTLPVGYSIDLTKYPVGTVVGTAGLTNTTSSLYAIGAVQVASGTTLQITQITTTTNSFLSQTPFTQTLLDGPNAISQSAQTPQSLATLTGVNNLINFGVASISISFQVKFSIAQWSSQINLATDFTEFASNTSTTDAADTVSFYNGKDGAQFPAALTATRLKRIQFSRPMQVTDLPLIEVYDKTVGQWFPIYSHSAGSLIYSGQNTAVYGMYIQPVTGSSTQFDVAFAQYARPTGSTFGAAGESWVNYNNGTNAINRWRVRKIANGNTSEQLPVVRAEYQIQDAHALEANYAQINFLNKIEDTHSATTVGSSWKYTCPIGGIYEVNVYIETNLGQYNQWDNIALDLFKNGQNFKRLGQKTYEAAVATSYPTRLIGTGEVRLNTGDFIDVRLPFVLANGSKPTAWSSKVSSVTASTIVMATNIAPDTPQTGTISFLRLSVPTSILTFTYTSWATTTFSGMSPAPNASGLVANDLLITSVPRIEIARVGN